MFFCFFSFFFVQTLILGNVAPIGFKQRHTKLLQKIYYEIFNKEHKIDTGKLLLSLTILDTNQKFTREVIVGLFRLYNEKKKVYKKFENRQRVKNNPK